MLIETLSTDWQKMAGTDLAGSSFASIIPTATEPVKSSTRAIIDLGNGGAVGPNLILACPVGTGANNAVLTGVRFYGWRKLPRGSAESDLWVPVPLVAVDTVFGNVTGATGSSLIATYFFMDTINLIANFGVANVNNVIQSNQADLPGFIIFDAYGFQKLEIDVDLGANATAANCLVAKL